MHESMCILAESKHAFIGLVEQHAFAGVYETGVVNISVHICFALVQHVYVRTCMCSVCARMSVQKHP